MDAKLMSGHQGNQSAPEDNALRRIADLLGVPVAAFNAPEGSHQLYTDPDGAVYALMADAQGVPLVCCIISTTAGQHMTQESVAEFIARDPSGAPQQALGFLIERLLITHLTV